ncbi:P-loop containing nucleoside triphosphate hydrolase protein [Xylariales sp. AK1849]|nr:P-loop containing nucleoside triphosphate hydrolase protein [Xylariales sp. AK1849]
MPFTAEHPGGCRVNSDDQFGPRVDVACRPFDFTLLFEDGVLAVLTAGLLLLLLPVKLRYITRSPCPLGFIFLFRLLFLIFRLKNQDLHTRLSVASGILELVATMAAAVCSFLQDQRSQSPSDVLVLYLSAAAITSLPRLHSLWLIPSGLIAAIMWTFVFIGLCVAVIIESLQKTKLLRPQYASIPAEQGVDFWSRSFFIWVLPFFRIGYTEKLDIDQFPAVDTGLKEHSIWKKLYAAWSTTNGSHRLLRSVALAHSWVLLSAIIPRIALSAFTFSQPFLLEATISLLEQKNSSSRITYGPALVGAFILVYLGIAISRAVYWRQTYRTIASIRSGLISALYRHTTSLQVSDVKDSAAVTSMGTEVGIGAWLLTRQLSVASVVPLIICIVSVVAASQIGKRCGPAQRVWIERVEKRVAVTANMLSHMRTVKILGLTNTLGSIISNLRSIELKTSEKFRGLLVGQILTGNIPSTLAPFATFITYAIIARVRQDESIFVSQAFASLSLINLLTNPLIYFCQSLPSFLQAMACFAWDFLDTVIWIPQGVEEDDVPLPQLRPQAAGKTFMSWDDAYIAWPLATDDAVLHRVSLTIRNGLTAIFGPVASGKSTLLASMIAETTLRNGSMTASLTGNVIGCLDFDQKWYDFSVSSCGLSQDISNMPAGDQTIAGSRGAALSGGQKQRIALARTVYSRLPVAILDDPMSGFDSKTYQLVSRNLFGQDGYFRKMGRSVVLVTHRPQVLRLMDTIVVLLDGRVIDEGSYEALQPSHAELLDVTGMSDDHNMDPSSEEAHTGEEVIVSDAGHNDIETVNAHELNLRRQNGNWSVYIYYFQSAGRIPAALWAVGTLTSAVCISLTTIWIQKWTEANQEGPNQSLGFYFGIYALLVVLANLGIAAECWFFFREMISTTALKLNADLLRTTLHAPFSFFLEEEVGTLTNSQDMDLIDMTLPNQAIQFTTGAASCIVQLVIICIYGKYVAALITVLAVTLLMVQRYYLRTSRHVRLIDIEAKAPLYRQTDGPVSKAFLHAFCIQQWLSLVLDLIVGGLAVLLVTVATCSPEGVGDGAIGVALVLVLDFNSLLTQTIQAWTKLETSIGAVARIQDFVRDTPTEPQGREPPPPNWPPSGAVQFHNYSAAYKTDGIPTLIDISLNVAPGAKVAICGPSGSGKSSLILALLQMMESREGRIEIDGIDISTLAGTDVRSRINFISQESFFIPGTLRANLDPQCQFHDHVIEQSIRKVGLWDKWSQGEKQLLCLAKALLVTSQIFILDEATSSADTKTEAITQHVLETEFASTTVISIVHKFRYIERFDYVAVLDYGRLVEFDTPHALLDRESAFSKLYHAQG